MLVGCVSDRYIARGASSGGDFFNLSLRQPMFKEHLANCFGLYNQSQGVKAQADQSLRRETDVKDQFVTRFTIIFGTNN
jgi:hypothetical protein